MSINENSAHEGAVRSNGLIVYGGIAVAVIIALNVLLFTSGNYRQRGGPAKPLALQGEPFFKPPPQVKPAGKREPTIVQVKGEKPEEKKAGEYLKLSFDRLAGFTYQPPHPGTKADERRDQVPEEITKLTGKRVQVEGYLVPLSGRNGLATKFILSRTAPLPGCCPTDPLEMDDSLKMNEWIGVIMEDGLGVPVNSRISVTVYGTLEVGEEFARKFLFTVPGVDSQHDLGKGVFSEKLRGAFAKKRIKLPDSVAIETKNENKKWRITAEDTAYIVKREDGALNIYCVRDRVASLYRMKGEDVYVPPQP